MVKLRIVYEKYARYENSSIQSGVIIANTLRETLLEALNRIDMYCDKQDILEQEKERGSQFSDKEIIDNFFLSVNGDGCDFIHLIKDEVSQKIYYNYNKDDTYDWVIDLTQEEQK